MSENTDEISRLIESTIRVICTGDYNVGQSCFLKKWIDDTFEEQESTGGCATLTKNIKHNNFDYVLNLWDIGGHSKFYKLKPAFYRGTKDLVFLFFDLTNRDSFINLSNHIEHIKKVGKTDFQIITIGTKIDLIDENSVPNILDSELDAFADKYNSD